MAKIASFLASILKCVAVQICTATHLNICTATHLIVVLQSTQSYEESVKHQLNH